MVISGRNPVFEALAAGKAKKIIVRHGASVHFDNVQVPFEVLGRSVFEAEYGEETQGVVAIVDEFEYTDYKTHFSNLKNVRGVAILDKIQDPHNFGAIIRAAHCFGINDIIVPKHDQARVTPSVFKASAGALFYCNVIEVVNLGQTIDDLKNIHYTIAAADMDGDVSLPNAKGKVNYPLGVLIGSEGKGIRDSLMGRADVKLSIPMKAKIDSLNAAMSAAVIFYELFAEE